MSRQVRRASVRARLTTVIGVALLATVSLGLAPATGAVTLVRDPERNSSALTGWGWHPNASPTEISTYVAEGNRIIDLEVTSSAPTFSVSYVKNSATYARSWWWYYGVTASQITGYLTTHGARLIDIEPYTTASGLRFAAVMVANTGSAEKTWWWHSARSESGITSFLETHDARIVDLDRYSTASGDRFAVIYIKNTGVDAKSWWYYYSLTPAQITGYLATYDARLIDMERVSAGRYDVVMTGGSSPDWWWTYGKTPTSIANLASQQGARIYKIEPYRLGTSTYYAALLINDANAETTRIRNLVSGKMTGSWGFYVKKVGGSEVVGLQPDRVFEPASMIKILHAVRALRQVQAGTGTTLSTHVMWYAHPDNPARYPDDPDYVTDKNICAYDSNGLITTRMYNDDLRVIIDQTLKQSDNRTTDALVLRYGFASLNALADTAGMTRTELRHRIGCQIPPWQPHNDLTLRDAGRIYEGVEDLTLLDATRRGNLHSMLYTTQGVGGDLSTMVSAEGAAAGLTTAEITAFKSRIVTRSKGGGYSLCPDGGGPCDPSVTQNWTVGGVIWIPFKNASGVVSGRPYVYGHFINAKLDCTFDQLSAGTCTVWERARGGLNTIDVEMFRSVVRQAVATW